MGNVTKYKEESPKDGLDDFLCESQCDERGDTEAEYLQWINSQSQEVDDCELIDSEGCPL